MNNNICIYKIQICKDTSSYYYLASDINAVFELKFDNKIKNIELVADEYFSDGNEHLINKSLFRAVATSESVYWIVADNMKSAYDTLQKRLGIGIRFFDFMEYVAPINYVKSFKETSDELEAVRIG